MERIEVLHNLEAIISKVVDYVREDSINLEFKNKNSKFYVRSLDSTYFIYEKETDKLKVSGITDIDFVRAIIKSLDEKNDRRASEVIDLECKYKKHIDDMLFYVNSYKNATDHQYKEILEDRFNMSKCFALQVKRKIKKG